MKVTPLAQGPGVPAQSEGSTGRSIAPDARARAIAIASGQEAPTEQIQPSGDAQVDRINTI